MGKNAKSRTILAAMRAIVPHVATSALSLFTFLVPAVAMAQYGEAPGAEENVYVEPAGPGAQAPGHGPAPGYGQPAYGPPPPQPYGYGAPPPSYSAPPPPARIGPQLSVRFNPFDLLEGRASFGVDYAAGGPFTIGVAPSYVYGRPVYVSGDGYDVGGWALALQPGIWISGLPFRGLGLKLHLEHESVTYRIKTEDGSEEKKSLGLNKIGAMLVSQSVSSGWFSLSYGLGLKKNLSYDEAKHTVTCPGMPAGSNGCIVADGIGQGWEIIGELGLGVVF